MSGKFPKKIYLSGSDLRGNISAAEKLIQETLEIYDGENSGNESSTRSCK